MNILHISSNYFGSAAFRKIVEISKSNFDNTYVFVATKTKSNLPLYSKEDIIVYKKLKPIHKFLFHSKIKKSFKFIYKQLLESSLIIDSLHAHTLFVDGGIAYLLKKKMNIDYIVTIRNTDINGYFKYFFFLRYFGLKIMLNSKKIILLTPAYKKKIFTKYVPRKHWKHLLGKIEIIPNGINNYWFNNKVEKLNVLSKNNIKLLYVGRFYYDKNILKIIKVHKLLLKNGISNSLTLIGNENISKFEKLIYFIAKHNKNITVLPKTSKEELKKYYRQSDIYVMPSHYESFGLTYIEALTQGKPVVYTKNEGIDRLFPNGYIGYSVNSRSVKDIYNAILKIIDNYETISANCLSACDEFKWSSIKTIYLQLFK